MKNGYFKNRLFILNQKGIETINTVYRHYGSNKFDRKLLESSFNSEIKRKYDRMEWKPFGLWGSPVECNAYTWEEWCLGEDFHIEKLSSHFNFTLKKSARILKIINVEDAFPYIYRGNLSKLWNNFEDWRYSIGAKLNLNLIYKEFDAMEVSYSKTSDFSALRYSVFNTWDCDSIVVWNPNMIVSI